MKTLIIFLLFVTQLCPGQIIKKDSIFRVPYPAMIDMNKRLIDLILYKGKKKITPTKNSTSSDKGIKYDLPPASNYSTAGDKGVIPTPYRVPLKKYSLTAPDLSDENFMGNYYKPESIHLTAKAYRDSVLKPMIIYSQKKTTKGIWKIIGGTACWIGSGTCFGVALSDHYNFEGITNINIVQYKNVQQIVAKPDFNNINAEINRVNRERKNWIIAGCGLGAVGTLLNIWGIVQVVASSDGIKLVKRF